MAIPTVRFESSHEIYTVTAFQRRIVNKTGVRISVGNLCNYVNDTPKLLRLDTVEILCTALECELSAFLQVRPKKMDSEKKRKLSFKNTPTSKIAVKTFPEPEDYNSL